ncbi:MAG TPA: hypothetical protein VIK79_05610 [Xanthobacteraceae bacterium]|jgi:hypothetical protein
MHLIGVVDDHEVPMPGYLRHTFECMACSETETRLLFIRERPIPVIPAPVTQDLPASTPETTLQRTSETPWERAIAKVRNHQQTVLRRKTELRQASERAAEFDRQWGDPPPGRRSNGDGRAQSDGSSLWARAMARLRPLSGSEKL